MKRLILIPFLLTACAHPNRQSTEVASTVGQSTNRTPAATGECAEAERLNGWNTAITEDQNDRPLYNHLLEYNATGRITNVTNDVNSACTVYTVNVAKMSGSGSGSGKAIPQGNFAKETLLRIMITNKNDFLFSGINPDQEIEVATINHYHDDMSLEITQRSAKHTPNLER